MLAVGVGQSTEKYLRMTHVRAMVSTWQHATALDVAAALDEFKVAGVLTPNLAPMVTALERKLVSDSSLLAISHLWLFIFKHDVDYRGPCTTLAS